MCTVSIFAQKSGLTVTMNRDEQRTRSEATNPHCAADCFFPIDSQSGGTWCGLHRNGYALMLLNRYESGHSHIGKESRGLVIPALLAMEDPDDIPSFFTTQNLYRFSPFDLLLVDSRTLTHFSWNGQRCLRIERPSKDAPFFYTSSSERTREVVAHRRKVCDSFKRDFVKPTASELLHQLHSVRDAGKPRDGILVDRPKVHTKSICQISLGEEVAKIQYWPEAAHAVDKTYRPIEQRFESNLALTS
ncbi:MAG: NRDE family protein [Verrucomicrobiota bacterium]